MKLRTVYTLISAVCISLIQCSINNADNTSETGNASVVATLYNSDGTPAMGVQVYIRAKHTFSEKPLKMLNINSALKNSTITDITGRFAFDSTLDTGTYVIEAASGNNAVLIDSVKITNPDSTQFLPPATLKPVGALKGVIHLTEGGDTRKVFILAFGIDRFASVEQDGSFLFKNLAEAKYDLRIISSIDNYGVLDTSGIIVNSAQITDLDTIKLPFTGITTPKNLRLSYDTMLQVVTLVWDGADTASVKSYSVYRRNAGLNALYERISTSPVADTVFTDGTVQVDSVYEYTVAAINPAYVEGTKSAGVKVKVTGAYRISDTLFTAGGPIYSITCDKNGNYLVCVRKPYPASSDTSSYKMERYGKQGNLLNSWDIQIVRFEDNDFSNKIAIDDSNFIYVAFLNYVFKFDSSGTIKKQITLPGEIRGMSVFKDTIYFGQLETRRIFAYSTSGDSLFSWGAKGFTDGHFENLASINCDAKGLIYIADAFTYSRVQVFDRTGTFIRSINFSNTTTPIGGNIIITQLTVKDSLLLVTGTGAYGFDLNGKITFTLRSIPDPVSVFFDYSGNLMAALFDGNVLRLKRN